VAARYGAALNQLLDRDASRNRIRIGDATVAFWADASSVGEDAAKAAENAMAGWFEPSALEENDQDAGEAAKLWEALKFVAAGRPIEDVGLGLKSGTRFYVLGLAPNAARLSIRYWLEDDFSTFARRLAEHYRDLLVEPPPWRSRPPSIRYLLAKTTALQEKFDNIPPLLAGEVARAVLTGARYPRMLLSIAITRLRAGDDASVGWHAAAIKAVLARDYRLRDKEGPPVSLNRNEPSSAYQLGRLFAAAETAQRLALGKINATIRDRYFGAASSTPASVFPLLMRGVQNHLGKLRKEGKGGWLEREIEEITDRLPPALPRALPLEAQGRFVLGYYHQRRGQFADREAQTEIETTETEGDGNDMR
jgi:CRISPR-associated protein Csd1